MRLLLAALLAGGSAAPAAARFRAAVPGSISVVPAGFVSARAPGPASSFSPAASPTALPAPSLALAPVAPLAVSAIPGAAVSLRPAKDAGRQDAVSSFKDLGKLLGGTAFDASAAFDGAAARAELERAVPAGPPLPLGARSVSVVRLNNMGEVRGFIPTAPNTVHFLHELAVKWRDIGWLDLRIYTDGNGDRFRAVDLSGRRGLERLLPEVEPHEAALIRKIQLHSKDLQLMIREAEMTPDLIVGGVVTEMKSLILGGKFRSRLEAANEQVLAHATRHRLSPGGAAFDLPLRDWVPIIELREVINDFVRRGVEIGIASISVYAGKDRQVFVRGKDGLFYLRGPRR